MINTELGKAKDEDLVFIDRFFFKVADYITHGVTNPHHRQKRDDFYFSDKESFIVRFI